MADKSTRFIVLELLNKIDSGAYSNLILDSMFKSTDFTERDKSFISHLFYGIIERKITLEYIISMYSSKPLQKLDDIIINILKIGLYQLQYMDSVPDNAAVNETVKLTKQIKKGSASGFVNAILRNFIRDGKKILYPTDKIKCLSVKYSCDIELTQKICSDYSYELAESLLKSSLEPHKTFIRVNTLKTTPDKLIHDFSLIGITAEKSEILDNCLVVDKLSDVSNCELYLKGNFHVQDLSSQLCCHVLNPQPGETIIDICAAPGGKTFTIAEMMNDNGHIIAADLHEKRVNLIKKSADQLKITIIETIQNDAKKYNKHIPLADKILCDVPCSGFGVMRSKPELKYVKSDTVKQLSEIQYEILTTASRYLKKNGELVYSTCTLNKDENDNIIHKFLKEHKEFEAVDILTDYPHISDGCKATIFPEYFGCEGFFISKIRKVD